MHCQAIPSNLDRAKQGAIDSTDLHCLLADLRYGQIDPLTDDAVKQPDVRSQPRRPETTFCSQRTNRGRHFRAGQRVKKLLPLVFVA
jgi:hypothetical protein